jgi:hypothetical protein
MKWHLVLLIQGVCEESKVVYAGTRALASSSVAALEDWIDKNWDEYKGDFMEVAAEQVAGMALAKLNRGVK